MLSLRKYSQTEKSTKQEITVKNIHKIVSLIFVTAIAIVFSGCATPGMTFRGPVQDGGEHEFSPNAENWGLTYNEWALKKFGRKAQRADLAYMEAARIGEQYANLKRKFMNEGLSEHQANYIIRTQYLEKLDPGLRNLVAIQMGYGGYYGSTYSAPIGRTQSFGEGGAVPGGPSQMTIWNGAIWPTGVPTTP